MPPKPSSFIPGNYERKEESPSVPLTPDAVEAMVQPKIEKLKKEIEGSKKELVTILGIFASFITFTSVDFQLLKNVTNIGDYLSLTLLLLAAMLIFVFGLKNLINEEIDPSFYKKPLFVMIASLVGLSMIFYVVPHWSNSASNKFPRKSHPSAFEAL